MVREYVESGLGCEARDTFNSPAPRVLRSMPRRFWQEVVVEVKEPIGGSHARQEGVKMDKTTLYQSQVNGSVGKFDRSSVKVIHGAGPKKEVSKIEGQEFLVNYRNTPHDNTGKYPRRLLRNRAFRTKVPAVVPRPLGKARREVSQAERKQKEQYKNYADKVKEEKDIRDDSAKEEKDMPDDSDKEEKEGQ